MLFELIAKSSIFFYVTLIIKVFKIAHLLYKMIRYWKPLLLLNYSLRPVMMNNTCPPRITATAGTKLVGPFLKIMSIVFLFRNKLYDYSYSFFYYYWITLSYIVQDSLLLSPLRLGLVSVPVWLSYLSVQLRIVGLGCFDQSNYLILPTNLFNYN